MHARRQDCHQRRQEWNDESEHAAQSASGYAVRDVADDVAFERLDEQHKRDTKSLIFVMPARR